MEFYYFYTYYLVVIKIMNKEKGITLIELIVTIFLIGITSILTSISLSSINNKKSNNYLVNEYLDEKLRLCVGLNAMYKVFENDSYHLSYTSSDRGFKIYRKNNLIIEYHDNFLSIPENNTYYHFKIIKDIKLDNDDDYLYIRIFSEIENEVIKMRWLNE